jgi:sugar/nucleoside kinase (ribokinase family)
MNREKKLDAVVVGDIFIDLVMSGFRAWPQPGEEAFAEQLAREIGGGTAITACGLAQRGMRVALLAVVGRDDGNWVIERLIHRGVATGMIRFDSSEPTALTVSVSSAEDRAFFTYPGANRTLPRLLDDAEVRTEMTRARHIHLACAPEPELLGDLCRALHAEGCTVSLDVGWQESWLRNPQNLHALREVDLFFPNEREAELMTGQSEPQAALRIFADAGARAVGLKLGDRGAILLWNGEVFIGEPFPIIPLDTTGAGDCFDAGFLAAWLRGESPETCLRIANACGALSTRRLGGIAAFPTSEELSAAIEMKIAEPQSV